MSPPLAEAAVRSMSVAAAREPTIIPVSIRPRACVARLKGMFFETNKSFLLPVAFEGIRAITRHHDAEPGGEVLVVGHTDTTADDQYNLKLSVERAEATKAFLTDDVEHWMGWFGADRPVAKRFGTREIQYMLRSLKDEEGQFYVGPITGLNDARTQKAVRRFQAWSNDANGTALPVNGNPADAPTRREIVRAYMAIDGTTLPPGTTILTHGCGEFHNAVPAGDNRAIAENRRVEVFVFEGPVEPPPGPCARPGCSQYPKWVEAVCKEIDLTQPPDPVVTKATWSKPAVIPENDEAPAKAEVEAIVETDFIPDGTPASIDVLSAVTGEAGARIAGTLVVQKSRVVDAATGKPPVFRFTAEHHERFAWEPPDRPFYAFRVSFGGGVAARAESSRDPPAPGGTDPSAALRLRYSLASIGNFLNDLPGASQEVPSVAATAAVDPRFHAAQERNKEKTIPEYGKITRNRYVVHHTGHGVAFCNNHDGQITIDDPARPLEVCPHCGSTDVEVLLVIHKASLKREKSETADFATRGRGLVLVVDDKPTAKGRLRKELFLGPTSVPALPNAPKLLFFASTCQSARNRSLANALFARGTRHYIGWGFNVDDLPALNVAIKFYRVWIQQMGANPDKVPDAFAVASAGAGKFQPRYFGR